MLHYDDDSTFDAIYAAGEVPEDWWLETRIILGDDPDDPNAPIYEEDSIIKCGTSTDLFTGSNPCIGAACAETLDVSLYEVAGQAAPDLGDRLWVSWCLHSTLVPSLVTDWHISKPYDVANVTKYRECGVWRYDVRGLDAMGRADVKYLDCPGRSWWTDSDPDTCPDTAALASDIAALLGLPGIETQSLALLQNNAVDVPKPDDSTTCRELLQQIAATVGSNARIIANGTTDGSLHFLQFHAGSVVSTIGINCASATLGASSGSSDGWDILLTGGADGNDHDSGTMDGGNPRFRLEVSTAMATDQLAGSVLNIVAGVEWVYQGFRATSCLADMRLEEGDWVTLAFDPDGEVTEDVMIASVRRTFDHAGAADLSAPDPARMECNSLFRSTPTRGTLRAAPSLRASSTPTYEAVSRNRNSHKERATATPAPSGGGFPPVVEFIINDYRCGGQTGKAIPTTNTLPTYISSEVTLARLATVLAENSAYNISADDLTILSASTSPDPVYVGGVTNYVDMATCDIHETATPGMLCDAMLKALGSGTYVLTSLVWTIRAAFIGDDAAWLAAHPARARAYQYQHEIKWWE